MCIKNIYRKVIAFSIEKKSSKCYNKIDTKERRNNMNVTLPVNKLDTKSKIVYISIISICILSILLVLYVQYFDVKTVTKVGTLKGKSEEGYEILKSKFNELFTNSLQKYDEKYQSLKKEISKDLVYTGYTNKQIKDNSYNIDVKIPYINIDNSTINKYNQELKETFEGKAEDILKTKNKNSTYTVVYSSYIQDGILSIIIRAYLKEGSNPQRIIIETYNYNLDEEKEINLSELLNLKSVDKDYVQQKVNEEIELEHKKAEDLKAIGHPIFDRNLQDEMYKVENIEEFYYHDGSIYIIFPYGNDKHTSELDIVII